VRQGGAGRRRRRGGRGELGDGVAAPKNGHQGLASGGGDALEVEVARASGEWQVAAGAARRS
jgi:hypothetical protein